MKKFLLILVVILSLSLTLALSVGALEVGTDDVFVLTANAGDKQAGEELSLWSEDGEGLVWYINDENKLVSVKTSELTLGFTAQTQSGTEAGYGGLAQITNAQCLSSISVGDVVIQNVSGTKKIVVANLQDADFDYIYTNSGSMFANNDTLQCLYLPDDIQRLPERLLYCATSLTKFDMGESVVVVWNSVFAGATSIQRVDFSNTCLYIPAYTFQNCTSLKEVHLGSSLHTAYRYLLDGTGTQMIDLYVPETIENFDAPYNNYVTIFFTGTLEQAQSKFPTFGVVNYTYRPYSEFDGTRTTEALKWIFYYDVSHCDAYDKGVHELEESLVYENGLGATGSRNQVCTKDSCSYVSKTEINPVFKALGYSVKEDGTEIIGGFKVNSQELNEYNAYLESIGKEQISYGIIVTNKNPGETGVVIENNILTSAKGLQLSINDKNAVYSTINYRISGFSAIQSLVDMELIISLYVASGTDMSFVQGETETSKQDISCNGSSIALKAISLRTIVQNTISSLNADLEGTTDESLRATIQARIDALSAFANA